MSEGSQNAKASLFEPEALAKLLRESPPPLLLYICSAESFAQAHIPGSVHIEPRELVSGTAPATGKLPPVERLQALFARIGWRADRYCVAYDDEGGGWAGRFLWTLDMIGARTWGYLNGGIHAWHAEGLPLATGLNTHPSGEAHVALQLHQAPRVLLEEMRSIVKDGTAQIWDARSEDEYAGTRSGSKRAGHMPGARNLDWLLLQDPQHALRLVKNLPELLADAGIDAGKPVVTHCQTHHRSGLTYLVGRLMNFSSIRAYDGSWSEWGNQPDTPVVQGTAPGGPQVR